MFSFILQRLVIGIVTLFGVAVMVFIIMRVIPGDAAVMLSGAGAGVVSEEELAQVRSKMGLDRPLVVQFGDWAGDVATLDLGTSLRTGNPVIKDIGRRFPYTAQIVVMATLIAVCLGIPAGVLSARFAGTWIDRVLQALSIGGLAAPSFWVGLILILGLVALFQWSAPLLWEPFWVSPAKSLAQLFWPALAVGLRQLALIARMTRSIMLEVLGEDYIRTARAKGLSEWDVVVRHGLSNGLLPVVTLIGFEFSALFGGLIITEAVFSVPGLGQYVVASILNRDYPAAQGIVLVLAGIVVLGNLTVDLIYGWLDPRTRMRGAQSMTAIGLPTAGDSDGRADSRLRALGRISRRHPLGAFGGVGTARYRRAGRRRAIPCAVRSGRRQHGGALQPAQFDVLARHRRVRTRHPVPPDLRRAGLTARGNRREPPRRRCGRFGRHHRRLSRRLDGHRRTAGDGCHAGISDAAAWHWPWRRCWDRRCTM